MIDAIRQYANGLFNKDGKGQADPAGFPVPGTDLREIEFVVFDTELTGLNAKKDSIVSVGAIRMRGGTILLGDRFYRVAEPRTALTAESVVIHGITPSEASGAPSIYQLLPEFLAFCGNAVLVGHVVSIDLLFMNSVMKQVYGKPLPNQAIDTLRLHQWIAGKDQDCCAFFEGSPEGTDLFTLAGSYHIPVEQAHNALYDAFVTAQLLQRFLALLPEQGISSAGDLLKIGAPGKK